MSKMFLQMIFVGVLVVWIEASPFQSAEPPVHDCGKPFFKRGVRECCKISKQRVWGDLSSSLQACGRKLNTQGGAFVLPVFEDSTNSSAMISAKNESMAEMKMQVGDSMVDKSPHGGKRIYDKIGEFMRAAYDVYKLWITILQDSLIMLTDRHGRRGNKECFIECVFEQEGFLTDNKLDKEVILARFRSNEHDDEEWHKVAVAAAETCIQKNFSPSTNSLCSSGAFEMFECVFKEIFFNCPSWPQNDEYCDSLKEFYEKCPNSPPPPIDNKLPSFSAVPENATERISR